MLKDLLWACPECGAESALRPEASGERCSSCGTVYRRGRGALIEAERHGAPLRLLPAAEWARKLPPVHLPEAVAGGAGDDRPLRQTRVEFRMGTGYMPVHRGREYLGRIERLGPPGEAEIRLHPDHFRLRETGTEDAGHRWAFDEITAVQPSSSTLQIKARGRPVVSLRFPLQSVRLWQELLQSALQRHYRRNGRGTIIEFQPSITTR